MIGYVKACTVYLLALLVFVASAAAGVDGMVLCLCADGGVQIEKSCGDADTCCDMDSVQSNVTQSEHECNNCTDLPLNGLGSLLVYSTRATSKTAPDTYASAPPSAPFLAAVDTVSTPLGTAIQTPIHTLPIHNLSTVFRI